MCLSSRGQFKLVVLSVDAVAVDAMDVFVHINLFLAGFPGATAATGPATDAPNGFVVSAVPAVVAAVAASAPLGQRHDSESMHYHSHAQNLINQPSMNLPKLSLTLSVNEFFAGGGTILKVRRSTSVSIMNLLHIFLGLIYSY